MNGDSPEMQNSLYPINRRKVCNGLRPFNTEIVRFVDNGGSPLRTVIVHSDRR